MKPGEIVLTELAKFAASQAPAIAEAIVGWIGDFRRDRPELCEPDQPCAPPVRSDQAIDDDVDAMIERGEL